MAIKTLKGLDLIRVLPYVSPKALFLFLDPMGLFVFAVLPGILFSLFFASWHLLIISDPISPPRTGLPIPLYLQ